MSALFSWSVLPDRVKLSITLDTLTARILKLRSDSQSRIEPTPFYSWWNTTDRRADSAVAPVAHKVSPNHCFQFGYGEVLRFSAPVVEKLFFHSCPYAFTPCIVMTSATGTVHTLNNAAFLQRVSVFGTGILASSVGMNNRSTDFRVVQARIFNRL